MPQSSAKPKATVFLMRMQLTPVAQSVRPNESKRMTWRTTEWRNQDFQTAKNLFLDRLSQEAQLEGLPFRRQLKQCRNAVK